jgi:hypothetical protein
VLFLNKMTKLGENTVSGVRILCFFGHVSKIRTFGGNIPFSGIFPGSGEIVGGIGKVPKNGDFIENRTFSFVFDCPKKEGMLYRFWPDALLFFSIGMMCASLVWGFWLQQLVDGRKSKGHVTTRTRTASIKITRVEPNGGGDRTNVLARTLGL